MTEKTYIDPEMRPALERMKKRMASRPPMSSVDPVEMRSRAREDFATMNKNPPEVSFVKDVDVEGAFGVRKARIYDALGERTNAPGLIYFHGGGWIVGDLDTEDVKLRRLAKASGVRIISYDYVLAPEHKFPEPLEDCVAGCKSIYEQANLLGLDASRLAIGGASAGANLALSTAIKLRDDQQTWLSFMLLFYGTFDMIGNPPSRKLFSQGFGMGADAMDLFFSLYVGSEEKRSAPLASPLLAELSGLPSAYVNAAGLDVLRDDSRALVKKLENAGVKTQYEEVPGVIHGYTLLAHEVSAAKTTIENAAQALRSALEDVPSN